MASYKYKTMQVDDAEWLTRIKKLIAVMDFDCSVAIHHFGHERGQIVVDRKDPQNPSIPNLEKFFGAGKHSIHKCTLQWRDLNQNLALAGNARQLGTVSINRNLLEVVDGVTLDFHDLNFGELATRLEDTVYTLFPRYNESPAIEGILPPALAAFYTERDHRLKRLEELQAKSVEAFSHQQLQLLREHQQRTSQLESEHISRRQALNSEYSKRHQELDERLNQEHARLVASSADLEHRFHERHDALEQSYQERHAELEAQYQKRREDADADLTQRQKALAQDWETMRAEHEQSLKTRRELLEAEASERDRVQQEVFRVREAELKTWQDKLAEREKTFDESDSRQARRQLRKEFLEKLNKRSQHFELTQGTTEKRKWPLWLFASLEVVAVVVLGASLYRFFSLPIGPVDWIELVKLPLSFLAFVGLTVYFIRWQDGWFREHAEEEFRLKRMELDIDRASWVVEMVMEWQDEKGQRLPAELIEKLSSNLFDNRLGRRKASHPVEDLASALIEASSGFSINNPQFGEIKLDRKSVKDFKARQAKQAKAEEQDEE